MAGKQIWWTVARSEEVGFEGCFSLQIYSPPFVPMVAVAPTTTKLAVATGIAVAGSRSLTQSAFAALELDRISEGRFELGIGTSIYIAI